MGFKDRLSHAWNAFTSTKDEPEEHLDRRSYGGLSFGGSTERFRSRLSNETTILAAIQTRIALDASSVFLRHVRRDDQGRYVETLRSGLQDCLAIEANTDQAASAFRYDIVATMLEKGNVAIVPIETSVKPTPTGGFDIKTLRVGHIVEWYAKHVKVSVYNELVGERKEIVLPKGVVAIAENPLYSVMNDTNSILKRVIRKLQLLDAVDEAAGSGKLDIIIQLPYVVKSETRAQQAEARRDQIETQLNGSKYGIAYVDSTERITQLNRPAENNMLQQIEYLMGQLYGQLGLDEGIFNGTASEETMLNYQSRTIKPILRAVTEAMARTFLTKTARTQGHTIDFQLDMFALVPISKLADIADKLLRNEVASSNEIRGLIGWTPSSDPKADKLVNSNMPQSTEDPETDPV